MAISGDRIQDRFSTIPLGMAGAVVVGSALHFWPFPTSSAWQILCPSNLICLLWLILCCARALATREGQEPSFTLPHVGLIAYVSISFLSTAFTVDSARAFSFSGKLALGLIGGYVLFCEAITSRRSLQVIYGLAIAAAALAISYCITRRLLGDSTSFGFHGNAYKYGTYVGILASLCGAYLLAGPGWQRAAGASLVVLALISAGSLGAVVAITAGMVVLVALAGTWNVRRWAVGALAVGVVCALALDLAVPCGLRSDITLAEADGLHLKQRYIEWQALINLAEGRAMTGVGAGCMNESRSDYYFHLPKLNTIGAFDQDGWLATNAEIGFLGLACLCWAVGHYFAVAWRSRSAVAEQVSGADARFSISCLAGLTSACVASLFSSFQYNGVLIAFVLVLSIITRTEHVLRAR